MTDATEPDAIHAWHAHVYYDPTSRETAAAREGGRDLPLRAAEGGGWQVEMTGRGNHTIQLGLPVPVRVTPEGSRLEIAVPEAASTRLSVVVPRRAVGERDRKQRAADAVARSVDLVLAGRLLDCVQCRQRALAQILVKAFFGEMCVGIDPGDAENSDALIDTPFDE